MNCCVSPAAMDGDEGDTDIDCRVGACCKAYIAVTKAPQDPEEHLLQVVWNAPVVVGKADEVVEPVT